MAIVRNQPGLRQMEPGRGDLDWLKGHFTRKSPCDFMGKTPWFPVKIIRKPSSDPLDFDGYSWDMSGAMRY